MPLTVTFRVPQFETDPDARSEVSVADVLDGAHLLAGDRHDALPHLQVFLGQLLGKFVVDGHLQKVILKH